MYMARPRVSGGCGCLGYSIPLLIAFAAAALAAVAL
jgi:hypothetical protein